MPAKRKKRRDELVDPIRTINWFNCLCEKLGTYKPREIQRILQPHIIENRGEDIKTNRYLEYSRGMHVPYPALVQCAEKLVKGSSWELNHVLWSVLRHKTSVQAHAPEWLHELVPIIVGIVFDSRHDICLRGDRHFLGSLERRASMDSLTALTVILRLNHERGDYEQVWECAKSIFRVLMIIGNEFNQRGISAKIFALYREQVFSLARFNGCRIYLEHCNYPVVSGAFHELSEHLRQRSSHARDRQLPRYYAMQILEGKRIQPSKKFFEPLVGPDLDMGPPTLQNLELYRQSLQALGLRDE